MTKINNDVHIYKAYLKTKETKGRIADLLYEFGISRAHLYNIIERVRNGDTNALRRCMEDGRFECLWEHKYRARFLALPDDRSATTVKELQEIIWGMKADEFSIAMIAEKTGKERSTVLYHLAKRP